MLWLYLLGAVTILIIALRRVRRQTPLDDDLYAKIGALDHVPSGVAWVAADGAIGSANPALAASLGVEPADLVGRNWLTLFPADERAPVEQVYRQALLVGIASLDTRAERGNGSLAPITVKLVSVHDHKMRLRGHHCLTLDRTRERELEERVKQLTADLAPRPAQASGTIAGRH